MKISPLLGVLPALVVLASCGSDSPAEPDPPAMEPSATAGRTQPGATTPAPARGEGRMTGVVLRNHLGCQVDGPCHLTLRTESGEAKVVYHYGEMPRCRNVAAVKAGMEVKVGDRIEVFGRYQDFDGARVLSTCDSDTYYIRL